MKVLKTSFFLIIVLITNVANAQTKVFTVNYGSIPEAFKNLTSVNIGPNYGINSAGLCYDEMGVNMIRTHDYKGPCDYYNYTTFYNTFTNTFDYSFNPNDSLDYLWANTDTQINKILNANYTPFFRLGISFPFSGDTIPVTPMPKDADGVNFTTFAELCKRTVMHYNAGWDSGYYNNIKYWEIWNEPNHALLWDIDSVDAYYRMYKAVADSIKNFDSTLFVGGSATAKSAFSPTLKHSYINGFFNFCSSTNTPLDFYSFHTYEQENPWHIKNLADTIRLYLDNNGFYNTKIIISEANIAITDSILNYQDSPKGCSYLTSFLLSAQEADIDNVFWYTGIGFGGLCKTDTLGAPRLTWNAYAYKCMNLLAKETPLKIQTTGNEVIDNDYNAGSNLMITSGKSLSGDSVYVLISNLGSLYSKFEINISNLPWTPLNNIDITTYRIQNNMKFIPAASTTSGNSNMTVLIDSVLSESVYLITLRNSTVSAIQNTEAPENIRIYPNPANQVLKIESSDSKSHLIQLYNLFGKCLLSKEFNGEIDLDISSYAAGMYIINIDGSEKKIIKTTFVPN